MPACRSRSLVAVALSLFLAGGAGAQSAGPPARHNNNSYGSPLDTLKSSRLWTDTPEPKAFVRDSRPPAGTLDYTPLTGTDPERAKPRDAANVAALQAEMERAGARVGTGAKRVRVRRADDKRIGERKSARRMAPAGPRAQAAATTPE